MLSICTDFINHRMWCAVMVTHANLLAQQRAICLRVVAIRGYDQQQNVVSDFSVIHTYH